MKQSLAKTNQETVDGEGGTRYSFARGIRTTRLMRSSSLSLVSTPTAVTTNGSPNSSLPMVWLYTPWICEVAGIRMANASMSKPSRTTCVTSRRLRQS